MDSLVSTEWLAKELGASDLRVVDASRFLPDSGRNAAAEYEAGHIPGAVFMDLERPGRRQFADRQHPAPGREVRQPHAEPRASATAAGSCSTTTAR